jgi:hypothetical protein
MWQSMAQQSWGNSKSGVKSLGKATVQEFNQKSKGVKLPKKMATTHSNKHLQNVLPKKSGY